MSKFEKNKLVQFETSGGDEYYAYMVWDIVAIAKGNPYKQPRLMIKNTDEYLEGIEEPVKSELKEFFDRCKKEEKEREKHVFSIYKSGNYRAFMV